MAKKLSKKTTEELKNTKEIITEVEVGETLPDRMGRYAMEVITNRALPDVIDGFKPSQRFWLYGMKLSGADGSSTIKSAEISGLVMGKLNPHANSYETGARMTDLAENYLTPFIQGQGTFGKHYSSEMGPSAERYTEMRLNSLGKELVDDCSKYHDGNMIINYNGKLKTPVYLSAPFPNILANANDGIAVGYACNLGSFNLKELCEASKIVIKNIKKSNKELVKDIMKVMPTMDFTTGGETFIDEEQIKNIYLNGAGAILLRAVFEDNKSERILELKGIPYATNIEAIMKALLNAVDSGKITEISDVRNEIGFDDKREDTVAKVAIDYKSGTDIDELKKKIFALSPAQSAYNANMNVISKGRPVSIGVIDCIRLWIEHRKVWVKEGLEGQLKEKQDYLHLLEGLEKILVDIEKAVKIVKGSKSDEEVIAGLKKGFKLDDIQAEFVANIKLRNFNKDYITNKIKEIKDLKAQIKDLQNRLKDIDGELIKDLDRATKEYGQDRKTKIVDKWEELPTFAKNTKEPEKLDGNSLVFTGLDWVKRVPEDSSVKAPNGSEKNIAPNNGEILIFTNTPAVFKWVIGKVRNNVQTKITDIKKIAKKLSAGDQIIYVTPLLENKKIVIFFDNGKAAKIPMSAWKTDGNKLCFSKGRYDKANIEYITSIEKDKIIEVNGKKYDTSKIKEVSSKKGQGTKVKPEK